MYKKGLGAEVPVEGKVIGLIILSLLIDKHQDPEKSDKLLNLTAQLQVVVVERGQWREQLT